MVGGKVKPQAKVFILVQICMQVWSLLFICFPFCWVELVSLLNEKKKLHRVFHGHLFICEFSADIYFHRFLAFAMQVAKKLIQGAASFYVVFIHLICFVLLVSGHHWLKTRKHNYGVITSITCNRSLLENLFVMWPRSLLLNVKNIEPLNLKRRKKTWSLLLFKLFNAGSRSCRISGSGQADK